MTASSDDRRNIVAGWEIPTATYSDQPFVVKTDVGGGQAAPPTWS